MTNDIGASDGRPFITRSKRPDFEPDRRENPEVGDDAEALGRAAREVLGERGDSQIAGASQPDLLTLRPQRGENVQWTALEGEAVLVDLETGVYFTLNRVGSAIWEQLDGERDLGGVLAALCDRFDATREALAADLRSFIADLERERLIRLDNRAG